MTYSLANIAQIVFTLALTVALGYCVLNLGPIKWMLQNGVLREIFFWLMGVLDLQGTEDAEDLLSLISLCLALPPSILICVLAKGFLQKRKR